MRRAATSKITGGADYARVPERLKLFREDCPKGVIETKKEYIEAVQQWSFQATAWKDGSKRDQGSATGNSLGSVKGAKDFEKLETVAVGRALALLGYLASGEIASTEEMEEFVEYQEQQKREAIMSSVEQLESSKTLEELKTVFLSLGSLISEKEVIAAKDKRKAELAEVK